MRPGDRWIGAASDNAAVRPQAFVRPGGRMAIVVWTGGAATIAVRGLPAAGVLTVHPMVP